MALYCDTGDLATFPPPGPPPAKPEGRAPWRPPDHASATCTRCGRLSWQHRSHPPVLADEIDRAIYAAAFVAEMYMHRQERVAVQHAEQMVDLHRRARSGT